jgi:gluconolactonase
MTIVRQSDSLYDLIPKGAQLERIVTGFQFTEGPVWSHEHQVLYFSDIPGSTIWQLDESRQLTEFRNPSNMANGLAIDNSGRLVTCEHQTSRLTVTEPDGTIVALASHFQDAELNSPNDVIVKSDGSVLFTDPTYGRTPFFGVERADSQPHRGVYSVDPADHALTLLTGDLTQPNGLCFTADERHLYIIDTAQAQIHRFAVSDDGSLGDSVVFFGFPDTGEEGLADGMKLDGHGNLYSTGPGGIWIISPERELLGRIMIPEVAANLAFGGRHSDKLFITASTSVYCLDLGRPGE